VADLTLAQLLAAPTEEAIRERLFGRLHRKGFPVTDFESGAIVRSTVEVCAKGIADFVAGVIPLIAAGGFPSLASREWQDLLGPEVYDLTRQGATYTVQRLLLTAAPGTGPYTLAAGDLVAEAISGNRYVLAEGGTIPAGGWVPLGFRAESPGSQFSDAAGQITKLVTPLPGVSVVNSAPPFSDVVHVGTGTGTVAASGTPSSTARFTLRIKGGGQANAATFEYSLDGQAYVTGGICSSTGIAVPRGITVTFTNGGVVPSFHEGDQYIFTAPGSPITTQGRDDETTTEFAARMQGRWPGLAEITIADIWEKWVREASAQVTKVTVRPSNSAAAPGRVQVLIAGAVNPLIAEVPIVQAYLNERHPTTDHPEVIAANTALFQVDGKAYVYEKDLDRIQLASQLAWQLYLDSVPIGGTVRVAKLAEILMALGAIDFRDLILIGPFGLTTGLELELDPTEVAEGDDVPMVSMLEWVVF
jgi:hypothetical protein